MKRLQRFVSSAIYPVVLMIAFSLVFISGLMIGHELFPRGC